MARFLHVTPREEQWPQRHECDMNRLWRIFLLSRDAARQRLPQLAGGKKDLGQHFIDWLISPDGQKAIANYKIEGEELFYPNANDPNA